MHVPKKILLSFDIEEFDMPEEYGQTIPFDEKIKVSKNGTKKIIRLLKKHNINATFFCTAEFARHEPDLIREITEEKHELASHGYFHSRFEETHLLASKIELEKISGKTVSGFRMPRMMNVSNRSLSIAGYRYNSSLNPVYLPGRYNNFFKPRTKFLSESLIQLPASAVPFIRFPLFWISFHNLPLSVYQTACAVTLARDSYLNIYFHPWELMDLSKYNLPWFVTKNSGASMEQRLDSLIHWLKQKNYLFSTISDFLAFKEENVLEH